MKSQLTINIDVSLKEEFIAYAKERKQSLSELMSGVLKNTVRAGNRKHVTISPYVFEMTSDVQLPTEMNNVDSFINAMEEKLG